MNECIQFDQFGIENLRLCKRPMAELARGMVRVEIKAVSLNYRDFLMVTGLYNPRLKLPLIPCSDGSGVVTELGPGVTEFEVGDRVCTTMVSNWTDKGIPQDGHQYTLGGPLDGVLSRFIDLPQAALVPAPNHLDFAAASCLPVAGLTAWSSLISLGNLQPGQRVLLMGTGGVSMFGLQIAKAKGAEVVITSSSWEKLERAKTLGADHLINYRETPEWGKAALKMCAGGVDLVLELGGSGTLDQSVKACRGGAMIAMIGVLAEDRRPVNLTALLMKGIRLQGILVGSRNSFIAFTQFLEEHRIDPIIDRRFQGLSSAPDALQALASAKHMGKIVIQL